MNLAHAVTHGLLAYCLIDIMPLGMIDHFTCGYNPSGTGSDNIRVTRFLRNKECTTGSIQFNLSGCLDIVDNLLVDFHIHFIIGVIIDIGSTAASGNGVHIAVSTVNGNINSVNGDFLCGCGIVKADNGGRIFDNSYAFVLCKFCRKIVIDINIKNFIDKFGSVDINNKSVIGSRGTELGIIKRILTCQVTVGLFIDFFGFLLHILYNTANILFAGIIINRVKI